MNWNGNKMMQYKFVHGDCMKLIKDIEDNSIDLVVTDCPYKLVAGGCTGKWKNKSSGVLDRDKKEVRNGKMFNHNDIKFSEWLPEIYRVLKDGTHCYIMINDRNLSQLQQEAEKVGFKFQRLLVWKKNNATPSRYYLGNAEYILMLRKGYAKNINDMSCKTVINMNNIIGKKVHPTEKPVDLMKVFIENSSLAGDVVLDPFMGSGSTAIACLQTDRKFIGFEIDEKYFDIACERMKHV